MRCSAEKCGSRECTACRCVGCQLRHCEAEIHELAHLDQSVKCVAGALRILHVVHVFHRIKTGLENDRGVGRKRR